MTTENILSTIALLAAVMRQVKVYVARSLKLLYFATTCQNLRESAEIPLSAKYSTLPNKLFYVVL